MNHLKLIILIQSLKFQMKKILLILIFKVKEKLKGIIHKFLNLKLNLILIKIGFYNLVQSKSLIHNHKHEIIENEVRFIFIILFLVL